MFEVEQKFRVEGFAEVEARLRSLGAEFCEPVEQIDRYFNHPVRDFRQSDEALRIRTVGEYNCITYKGPKIDKTTKTRREIELPLGPGSSNAEALAEMLTALSFRFAGEVRKTRRAASYAADRFAVEIAMDDVDQVGTFVELEIVAGEADLDAARQCLADLAARLGLEDVVRRSYLSMVLAGSGSFQPPC